MKEEYFINEAIDKAIASYISGLKSQDGILYNSFLVVTIRILSLIYGESDILNSYYVRNSVSFFNLLSKYGMSQTDVALFVEDMLSYYKFEKQNEKNLFKEANPYFQSILKTLVNMFILKTKNEEVDFKVEEEFLDLIYTTHTKNVYRISDRFLNLEDPLYMEKYYYSKINEMDVTRELGKTIHMNLNLDALNAIGISLSSLKGMSSDDIEWAKTKAYQYFEVDASSPNREEELKKKVDYYKMYGNRVTSGNGYVDILLLMSVIATTISVLATIIVNMI